VVADACGVSADDGPVLGKLDAMKWKREAAAGWRPSRAGRQEFWGRSIRRRWSTSGRSGRGWWGEIAYRVDIVRWGFLRVIILLV
jgi:hypothetical protein